MIRHTPLILCASGLGLGGSLTLQQQVEQRTGVTFIGAVPSKVLRGMSTHRDPSGGPRPPQQRPQQHQGSFRRCPLCRVKAPAQCTNCPACASPFSISLAPDVAVPTPNSDDADGLRNVSTDTTNHTTSFTNVRLRRIPMPRAPRGGGPPGGNYQPSNHSHSAPSSHHNGQYRGGGGGGGGRGGYPGRGNNSGGGSGYRGNDGGNSGAYRGRGGYPGGEQGRH